MKKNFVKLEGNVGFSPRMTTFENESSVMRLSMATNEKWKNKAGEIVEETMWHNIVIWSGDNMPDFDKVQKGAHLTIEGRLKQVCYQTKTGIERQTYEIIASKITVH